MIQIKTWYEKSFSFFRVTCNIQCPRNDGTCFEYSFFVFILQFELCLSFCCIGQEPIRYLKSLRGLKITDVTSLSLWFNKSNFLCDKSRNCYVIWNELDHHHWCTSNENTFQSTRKNNLSQCITKFKMKFATS